MRQGLCFGLVLTTLGFILTGCAVNTSGLGQPINVDVQPHFFCEGDPITISWDFANVPRSLDNCDFPNGGLPTRTTCTTTSECEAILAGARCIDGGCCASDISSEECGATNEDGCLPDLGLTITTDTLELDPPQDGPPSRVQGSRQVFPAESTEFTVEAGFNPPLTVLSPDFVAQTTLVQPTPGTDVTLNFPFVCAGTTSVYPSVSIGEGSENVAIVEVLNTSGNTITVQADSDMPPVTLRPGEGTDAFNGKVQPRWLVALSPLDPASLVPPRCEPTGITDPWPDLAITLKLVCAADPEE